MSGGPWYVVNKDTDKNIIFVSHGKDPLAQLSNEIWLHDLHYLNPNQNYSGLEKIKYKMRHQPEFSSGKLLRDKEGLRIVSDEKISGIAPGQFAVIYDWEEKTCVGSAMIIEKPNYL